MKFPNASSKTPLGKENWDYIPRSREAFNDSGSNMRIKLARFGQRLNGFRMNPCQGSHLLCVIMFASVSLYHVLSNVFY